MQKQINLNRLEIFKELVISGSFTQAAKKLNQPKSRISRQLSSLEQELGFSLIFRTTRQFQLTTQGKQFYQKISPLMTQLNSTLENFSQESQTLSGNIRFTLPEDLGVELMGQISYEFLQLHPAIHLEVHPENRIIDLVKEGFDVAIRMGNLKDSTLMQKKLCELKLVTVASPKLFDKFPTPKKISQLEDLPFLRFTGFSNNTNHISFSSNMGSKKLAVNPVFTSNNFFCLRSLCLAGQGFTILPNFLAKALIEKNELVTLFPEWHVPGSKAHIVYPQQKDQPLRVKKFIDFIQERITQLV
jgi:DNA-binding transcriptional LysR family regulator